MATEIPVEELSSIQKEFLAYWREMAADRAAPRRQDIDVLDVPKLMPHVIILNVLEDPLDFQYRLVGTAQREMSLLDYTGMKMSEIDGRGPGSGIWSILDNVRVGQKLEYLSIPYIGPMKDFVTLKDLFLPLVDDNLKTNMIIIVSHYIRKHHLA
jgi:PAS domain-containing protein